MTVEQMTVQQKLDRANKLNGFIASNFNAVKSCETLKNKRFDRVDLINCGRDCYSLAVATKYSALIISTLMECMKKDMEEYKEELEALFK